MAHQLNFNENTGKHSFFSVKEKAWHGLGQIVDQYPTSAAAIRFAGLDYEVEKRKLFTYGKEIIAETGETHLLDDQQISVPDFFATVRTDKETPLGVVGKDYEVVQNRDAFSFFDAIVGGGEGVLYETAGAFRKGYGK